MGVFIDKMGDEIVEPEEEVSKMFDGSRGTLSSDEELALHIMHRFNIDRETMETMPAFEEHLKPLFWGKEEE
jgi:hypothetical protein